MAILKPWFSPTTGNGVSVGLDRDAREALRDLATGYRDLLLRESQASDPAIARLFPPAYREDPLRNLDYDRHAHDGLMTQRLAAIDTVLRQTDTDELAAEDARSWLGVLNDLRLVLGTRLNISEEEDPSTFQDDPETADAFGLYEWLTALVGALLEAIDPGISEIEERPPPKGDG